MAKRTAKAAKPKSVDPEQLTVGQVAKAIKVPVTRWPGNCFGIAAMVVKAGLVKGVAVYGHYHGPIAQNGFFGAKARVSFSQHGWVALDDGRVLDPTRWVFENREPYIYVGPSSEEYDEGGNQINAALRGTPPDYDPNDKQYGFTDDQIGTAAWQRVEKILRIDVSRQEPGFLTTRQIAWLANADFNGLQPHAEAIYQAIEAQGLGAFIPQDNRARAKRLSKQTG